MQASARRPKPVLAAEVRALRAQVSAALLAVKDPLPGSVDCTEEVRHLARRCEELLSYPLSVPKTDDWLLMALSHLAGAADYLRLYATQPREYGNAFGVSQAAWLLGKAEAVAHESRWVNTRRSISKSKNAPAMKRIIEALEGPHASDDAIAEAAHTSPRYVRVAKARQKAGTK